MRLPKLPTALAVFAVAAALAVATASLAVDRIEARSAGAVSRALEGAGIDWPQVEADGMQLRLTGTAPDEAARFRALSVAGDVVESTRVVDGIEIAAQETRTMPDYAVELLRTDTTLTVIGLVPESTDRTGLLARLSREAPGLEITDLLQTVARDAPQAWDRAVAYGLSALAEFDTARVSIAPDRVRVESLAPSAETAETLTRTLEERAPEGIEALIDISAPRPVIAPFTLSATKTPDGARLESCAAETEAGAAAIAAAAQEHGFDAAACTLGLGRPGPDWPAIATAGLDALAALPAGTLTLSDRRITLAAAAGTDPETLAAAETDLAAAVPPDYTLTATLPQQGEAGPADFAASRDAGGVTIEGRLRDDSARTVIQSFAEALFGTAGLESAIETGPVPEGWTPRVMAGLDALSLVNDGEMRITEEGLSVSGRSGNDTASADIAQVMRDRLGEEAALDIAVRYDESLDSTQAVPSPDECIARIDAVLAERQITFAPGSATIDAGARDSVNAIADILTECEVPPMEIGGFTDSQGGDEMNRALSQDRADAVIAALMARRVPVSTLTAVGYGEADPIADNATAAGREANRRIEFALTAPEGPPADAPQEDSQ